MNIDDVLKAEFKKIRKLVAESQPPSCSDDGHERITVVRTTDQCNQP